MEKIQKEGDLFKVGNYTIRPYPFKVFKTSSLEDIPETPLKSSILFPNYFSLELIFSTKCNLGCDYCYAKKGEKGYYGLERSKMDLSTLKRSIDYALDQLTNKIRNSDSNKGRFDIYFMGGEPLLNKETLFNGMDYLNKRIEELKGERIEINVRPAISTNGTLLDEKSVKKLSKYDFDYIAITIDGEKHNEHRKYEDGAGTLDDILGNIQLLFKYDVNLKLVAVVPPKEVERMEDILEYYKKLDIFEKAYRVSIVPRAVSEKEKERSCVIPKSHFEDFDEEKMWYSKEEKEIFSDKLKEMYHNYGLDNRDLRKKLLNLMKWGGTEYCCPAAISKISVTPKGKIFPCHQLVNFSDFYMGDIKKPRNENFKKVKKKFKKRKVYELDKCKDCVLQTICPPLVDCPARSYLEEGSLFKVAQYCDLYYPYLIEHFKKVLRKWEK